MESAGYNGLIIASLDVAEKRFHTDLQQMFGMLKYREDKENLKSLYAEEQRLFRTGGRGDVSGAGVFLRSENKLKEIIDPGEEERIDMCKALDDIYADGVKDGEKARKDSGKTYYYYEDDKRRHGCFGDQEVYGGDGSGDRAGKE